MASSANVAIMALQRTLAVRPAHVTKKQQLINEAAQKLVTTALGGTKDLDNFDWMSPAYNDEEKELIDQVRKYESKYAEEMAKTNKK